MSIEEYRWNVRDYAAGYDASVEVTHPYYEEIQDLVLELLPFPADSPFLLVDLGGGPGRFAARFLQRFPRARAIVIDQSAAFLDVAARRLSSFGPRGECRKYRLQERWDQALPAPPAAIVSMSAIHHLEAAEKRDLYRRCYEALRPGSVLINADEVRPADDREYLAVCEQRAAHFRNLIGESKVPPPIAELLEKWTDRNVNRISEPRVSGDDCHETIEAQLAAFVDYGFIADCPWHRELWAILRGTRL